MADPIDAFRSWLGGHEIDYAVVEAASAGESLGLAANSLQEELDRIASTPSGKAASWATDPSAYRSAADTHLQYLAFWFSAFVVGATPHLAENLRLALCGFLKSRKRTPYTERDVPPGLAFVALPTGLLVSLDLYFRTHFRLRDLGRGLEAPARKGCVQTNAFGGKDIETAFARSWDRSNAILLQLEGGYLAAELFDPDLAPASSDFDRYEPDVIRSTAQVFHELSGRGGPFVALQTSPESQAATYLCTVFALFHELAHQLAGSDGIAMARALGITALDEEVAVEAAVDLLALSAYMGFVDEKSREVPGYRLIAAVPHPVRYCLGAAGFHAVGKSIHLAEWIFYITQSGQSEAQRAKRDRDKDAAVSTLQQRQAELALKLWSTITNSAGGTLDPWHLNCIGSFLEAGCVEVGLRVMLDRARFRRATGFCEEYRRVEQLLHPPR